MDPQGFIPDPEGFVEDNPLMGVYKPQDGLPNIPQPLSGIENIPVVGKPLATLRNLGQDIGATLGMKASQESPEAIKQRSDVQARLMQMIQTETDPEKKQRMIAVAMGSTPPDLSQAFSPDVEKGALQRGAEAGLAGGELALTGDMLDAGKDLIKQPVKEGIKFVSNPRKYWGEARRVAAESYKDVAIKGGDLWKAGERARQVVDTPTGDKAAKDLTSRLVGKTYTPQQLLDKMQVWKDAFSSTGKIKAPNKAKIAAELYREASDILAREAPEVAKYTAKLAKTYSVPKMVKGSIGTITKIGAGLGSLYGLKQLSKLGK